MKPPIMRLLSVAVLLVIAFTAPDARTVNPFVPMPVYANGFIDFEDGVDQQPIKSTIPGLEFITTNGQDWIYGDWRTGNYNGKYPSGQYTSNGNFFAWLGPYQGDGRINFTKGGATYLSVGISTLNSVTLRGYAQDGTLLAEQTFSGGNLSTGFTNQLKIETTASNKFSYAIISGQANYWLIDDLSTDAEGVPNTHTPLIFIPGIMGTSLDNRNGEVWPNPNELILDHDDDSLLVLRLQTDGESPLEPNNLDYSTVHVGHVLETADGDVYKSAFDYLKTRGYSTDNKTLYLFAYDWRKDVQKNAALLAQLIDQIKTETNATKVNILAHSMGGLVARTYINDAERAKNVGTLVTLGTPYLGAPKAFDVLHYGHACMISYGLCFLNPATTKEMVQNMPGAYELLPGPNYHQVYPDGHLNMDRDTNGDGVPEGWLDYAAIKALIQKEHNGQVFGMAEQMFNQVESYKDGTNGVKVYAFVGMRQGTPGSVREYMKRSWGGLGSPQVAYDFVTTNGDGTVPLHSADLGRTLPNDFSGAVSYFYARLEHGALAQYSGDGQAVLELTADMLEAGNQPLTARQTLNVPAVRSSSNALYDPAHVHASALDQGYTLPVGSPLTQEAEPLAGFQILVQGNTLLELQDDAGHVTQVRADDILESNIPGSSIYRLGNTTSIFVPDNQRYRIKVLGQGQDVADLKVRVISNDTVSQTLLYNAVPVIAGSTAAMTYTAGMTTSAQLAIDANADGQVDVVKTPDSVLDAQQSLDITPPSSAISVTYLANSAQALITINAQDDPGGTGLLRVEYSLDGGQSGQVYNGPFTVALTKVTSLQAKAIDKAGNEQFPLSVATISYRAYLPLVQK